jgi:NAD(P)-dependent dehydrogenase (short-subunit alcohol dehydrogenase family)
MHIPNDYQPQANALQDRVILITGAGDGIGRALAKACASQGARVILLGKTVRKLEETYDEIEALGNNQSAIYPMHLEGATPNDYAQLANTIQENYGRLDGIVHNAAQLPYLSRLKDYEAEDWIRVMQVNLNAPFLLTQACLDLLQASADASVVFTGDSVENKPFWGAYGVSKQAVESLMAMWNKELENTTVRMNTIDPGPTLTALRKRIFPAENNSDLQTPDEAVKPYLWLLGPDSQNIRGQRITN